MLAATPAAESPARSPQAAPAAATDPGLDPRTVGYLRPMATVPDITLNNGVEIPQLGFGVFLVDPAETEEKVTQALEIGYRHIDTAQGYRNEKEVGQAIRASGVDPAEIFVTSKLANNRIGYDDALAGFDATTEALGLDKVDLYLIHWPLATVRDFVDTWKAFERLAAEGRVRSVGVSNFQIHHLQRLFDETDLVPAVNQIEAHPYLTQDALLAFDAEHGIATEAWSPIARGAVIDDEVIAEVAKSYDRTPAQVVLRWHIQLGSIIFPKSNSRARMQENFELFDFELSPENMDRISALNKDERVGPDPDTFAMVPR
jgi:2,5-diketo-D-gluconate reductase A